MNFRESSGGTVAAAVKRQVGSKAMNRYAESLPCFRVDPDLPEVFKELLERLERAEESTLDEEPPAGAFHQFNRLDEGRLLQR
ncbi:hypothetical protein LB524_26225 [Mesorhizobium sp. ESP6-5]|uniref:hypothetical protein n=1 Tax=Mesorhizobium sp. ESP6-5 TaxID=2876623 RepID=UPI001CCD80B1|nr:hypothetical protein [Mesorhizobium sp. ESP6-5]MBZ9758791.1 hypothetical protein [Mesorhizobium sp. ESP6-5]